MYQLSFIKIEKILQAQKAYLIIFCLLIFLIVISIGGFTLKEEFKTPIDTGCLIGLIVCMIGFNKVKNFLPITTYDKSFLSEKINKYPVIEQAVRQYTKNYPIMCRLHIKEIEAIIDREEKIKVYSTLKKMGLEK